MEKTILVTVHGSHLYGLAKPDSDLDFFRVVNSDRRTQQKVYDNGFDVVQMGLDSFLTNVFNGSHQSCEALFSPVSWVDPTYRPLFDGIRVTGEDAFARYRRTIKSFSYGDLKKRRHAVRLGWNLRDLRLYGRFNPQLTEDQKLKAVVLSQMYWGQSLFDIASNF